MIGKTVSSCVYNVSMFQQRKRLCSEPLDCLCSIRSWQDVQSLLLFAFANGHLVRAPTDTFRFPYIQMCSHLCTIPFRAVNHATRQIMHWLAYPTQDLGWSTRPPERPLRVPRSTERALHSSQPVDLVLFPRRVEPQINGAVKPESKSHNKLV